MAEKETKTKKTTKVVKEAKSVVVADMTLPEAREELQKVYIQIKTGEEKNTTKVKSLKKQIARLLTKKE